MEGSDEISSGAKELIEQQQAVYVSLISFWELAVKINIGKLILNFDLPVYVHHWKSMNGKILPLQEEHIFHYMELPLLHRDPFDRLLIAQAHTEDMVIITRDQHFQQYKIKVYW